jgi:hypothetical protein
MANRLFVACLVASSVMFVGCGAMFNGSSKIINVQGSPEGARVTASPDIGNYTIPASLNLSRKNSYVLTFSKDGYREAKVQIRTSAQFGIIVLDVLFTGLIGVVVDAATGDWNNLSPDQVSVNLEKVDMGVNGPDQIEITVGLQRRDQDRVDVSSSSPVNVKVERAR